MELIVGKKSKQSIVIKLFIIVGVMSVLDGIISYAGIMSGFMEEGNPFMQNLWNISPTLFITFKLIVSLLIIAVGFLYKKSNQPIRIHIRLSTYLITALYSYVMVLHVVWISLI